MTELQWQVVKYTANLAIAIADVVLANYSAYVVAEVKLYKTDLLAAIKKVIS